MPAYIMALLWEGEAELLLVIKLIVRRRDQVIDKKAFANEAAFSMHNDD